MDGHNYIIRELDDIDIFKYLRLMEQLNGYTEDMTSDEADSQLRKMRNQGSVIILLTIADKIVATGKIFIEEKFYQPLGHIEDIVVHRKFRNQGLGSIIVKRLIEIGKSKGCYKIVLNAQENLKSFYGHQGFLTEGLQMVRRFHQKIRYN
jgi:predicted GNAT family N-acyltransferase